MKKINCRQFIGKSAMAAGAAFTLSNLTTVLPNQLHAAFKEEPIGFPDILCQGWAVGYTAVLV